MAKRAVIHNARRRWPRPPVSPVRLSSAWGTVKQREKRLLTLAYRALSIGYRKAQLSAGWVPHFKAKSERLLSLADGVCRA